MAIKWNLHNEQNTAIVRLLAAVLEELESKNHELSISNVATRFGTTYDSIYRVFEKISKKEKLITVERSAGQNSSNTVILEPDETIPNSRERFGNGRVKKPLRVPPSPYKTINLTRPHLVASSPSIEHVFVSEDDAMVTEVDLNGGKNQVRSAEENHASERGHYRNLYFPKPLDQAAPTLVQPPFANTKNTEATPNSKISREFLKAQPLKSAPDLVEDMQPDGISSGNIHQSPQSSLPDFHVNAMPPPDRYDSTPLISEGSFMDPTRKKCLLCSTSFGKDNSKFYTHERNSSLHKEKLLSKESISNAQRKVARANFRHLQKNPGLIRIPTPGLDVRLNSASAAATRPGLIRMHQNAAGPRCIYGKSTTSVSKASNEAIPLKARAPYAEPSFGPDTDKSDLPSKRGKGKARASANDLAQLRQSFPDLSDEDLSNICVLVEALQQQTPTPETGSEAANSKKRVHSEDKVSGKPSVTKRRRREIDVDIEEDGDWDLESGSESMHQFSSRCDDSADEDYMDAT